jgi:hypothetical protein
METEKEAVLPPATCSADALAHTWRVRKEASDGFLSVTQFTWMSRPLTAAQVAKSPCVLEWVGNSKIVDIYEPNTNLSDAPKDGGQTL